MLKITVPRIKRIVNEGERFPKGYGLAWRDFEKGTGIFLPLGIHLIVRWSRDFYWWIVFVGRPGWLEKREHEIYLKARGEYFEATNDAWRAGHEAGSREGWHKGWEEGYDAATKRIKVIIEEVRKSFLL